MIEVIKAIAIYVSKGEAIVAEIVHREDFLDAPLPMVDAMSGVLGAIA